MINQGLELKQQQKLSPLQIQTIKLIELPVQELEKRVREELEENPVLDDAGPERDENGQPKDVSLTEIQDKERSDASAEEAYSSYSDDIPSYNLKVNNWGKDERPEYNTFSVKQSFTQSLQEQLGFRHLTERERAVASFIIGSLDDRGYLRRDNESLVDDIAFRAGIETTPEEVERMVRVVQEFEPTGVGARDLRECLLLQLEDRRETPSVKLATTIIRDWFDDFSARHFQKIMTRLSIDKDQMKEAMDEVRKLNPAPGGEADDNYEDKVQQIVPDFVLDYENGQFILSMPRFSIPELRINAKYADILESAKYTSDRSEKEAAAFVKQKLDKAKWFIEAIRQRQNTLESTMKAIVEYQKEYFMDGDETKLRPMVLKDIADRTGFDISTVSRVVNSKYIETHFGVFALKYFFSEGLENKEGEEVSTREIKKVMKDLISAEDKQNPLTDDELVTLLGEKGYNVARRTIAKYRTQLDIPKARLRKEL